MSSVSARGCPFPWIHWLRQRYRSKDQVKLKLPIGVHRWHQASRVITTNRERTRCNAKYKGSVPTPWAKPTTPSTKFFRFRVFFDIKIHILAQKKVCCDHIWPPTGWLKVSISHKKNEKKIKSPDEIRTRYYRPLALERVVLTTRPHRQLVLRTWHTQSKYTHPDICSWLVLYHFERFMSTVALHACFNNHSSPSSISLSKAILKCFKSSSSDFVVTLSYVHVFCSNK